jgi:serine acetyltransferase
MEGWWPRERWDSRDDRCNYPHRWSPTYCRCDFRHAEQSRESIKSHKFMRARFQVSTYIGLLRAMRLNSLLHFMARVLPGGFSLRPVLHRWRGVKVGDCVWIGEDVYIDEDFPETIEIQEGAWIATRCTLMGHTKGPGKIIVGKNAAIGTGCVIVCGADQTLTIGEGAVVSAGSTILNDVPPFTLCGPPRVKIYGKVTIPYREAKTLQEFRCAVRPIKAKE